MEEGGRGLQVGEMNASWWEDKGHVGEFSVQLLCLEQVVCARFLP